MTLISGVLPIKDCIRNGYPFIESILSFLPIVDEYHVNDGGSTDGTLEALTRLSEAYPKIKVHRIPDTVNIRWDSCTVQSNALIKECRGKWLLLGNADEVFHEEDDLDIRNHLIYCPHRIQRFTRREVTHNWSSLSTEVYHPARAARIEKEVRMDWNAYGGDEFLYSDGWHDPQRKLIAGKYDPHENSIIPFTLYHIYNKFPLNQIEKMRHDAEYISPGDKHRVRLYEALKGSVIKPVPVGKVYWNLPALVQGLVGMPEYRVREELFDPKWVSKTTGLKY